MARRCSAGLLVLWLATGVLPGQRYSFKHYGQDNGLGNLEVQSLLQDRSGLLWIATENGLFRYNGRHFRAFTVADGLPAAQIWTLAEAPDGTIWVGSIRGIARRAGDRFEKVDISPARGTRSLVTDGKSRVIVGSERGLVVGLPDRSAPAGIRFRLYPNPPSARGPAAYGVAVGGDGKIWYGCGKRVCAFDGNSAVEANARDVPPDEYTGVAVDGAGNVWARSATRLIELPAAGHRAIVQGRDLPPSLRLAQLYLDNRGELLVPTSQGLAIRAPGGSWKLVRKENGLSTENVSCVLEDREHSLWLGLDGDGLVRWLGRDLWETWTQAEGLNEDEVWAIQRDRQGVLWAASKGGLARFDEKRRRWQPLLHPALRGGRILALEIAGDGTFWLSKMPGGVVHIDPRRRWAVEYGTAAGLADPGVFKLAVSPDGHVWAGTRAGLFEGTGPPGRMRFERVVLLRDVPDATIPGIVCDRQGRVWVATWRGLFVREAGVWRRFSLEHGLRQSAICGLQRAENGSVWVIYCEHAGMSQVSLEAGSLQLRHYSRAEGMRTDRALSVDVDPSGRIWTGSDQGIERFDGRAWQSYDKNDGLILNDCNAGALYADRDGSIWIGTPHGLSHFYAAGAPPRSYAAPVALTRVQFGGNTAFVQGVTVPYSARTFHASFAALSFVNEEAVRFRYRMTGLDAGWTETDNDEVQYPGLGSGQYTFEVQATAGPKWTDPPARFSFRVRPPWWLSWWGLLAEAVLCYAVIRLLLAWRLRHILRRQAILEQAVDARTRELRLERERVLKEKNRAEHEKQVVEQQKVEIERLFEASQEASRLKTQFLANISHEIRTPMNGIIGMTELVLQSELKDDQAECLRLVRLSADSLLEVINDVLDYSKIEAGRLDLDHIEFYTHDLFDPTVKSMEILARNKSLELRYDIAPDVPLCLIGDPGRLRQVLVNLMGNAIKFTARGSVSVEVKLAGDGMAAAGDSTSVDLQIAVRDTGIGIPQDKLQLIFEPFRQADGSTTRQYGGTGLGLAICAKLVELMRGRIWVQSRPGEGTVFYFTARLGVAERAGLKPPPAPDHPAAPGRSLRILVAEDNLVNQKVVIRILTNCGHQVICANNGREAVDRAGEQQFDIVLMDLQMPQMDGFEATSEIRKLDRALRTHTPIVALTANAMKGDRERCLGAGMDGYVPKPLKPAVLLEAIRELTGP